MKRNTLLFKLVCLLAVFTVLFSGCNSALPAETGRIYFQPISAITLPDEATLIGIGEATHGNAEFVQIRLDVLKELVQRYDVRTFAIEGDFGGSQVVNAYVLHGTGSAVEAVKSIGFAIYRTQEMVDLVEWIYQYNQSVAPEQMIHFYGFDMQRYDHNINGLLAYIARVAPDKVDAYRASLADLNDDTVFDQAKDKILAGLEAIKTIRAEMQQEKERYIAATSQQDFDLADQFAACIEENATLRGTDVNYSETRDRLMAEKVAWIVSYEKAQGREKVLIAGHNGHIEKSSASPLYRSMGSRLAETFGSAYYAIGTEFYESTFNSKEAGSSERKQFTVKNANALNQIFFATGLDVAYLDIQPSLAEPTLAKLLTSPQSMSNIGDEFSALHRFSKAFYTLKMAPVKAYDSLIFVRSATPTTMLPQ